MPRTYADLSRDELVGLLQARDRRDATRFGLVWEANEIEREAALNSDFVALEFEKEESTGTGPWENLIIEGDNFDALRYLNMSFAGKVKCVYIDPPYNTGNRDFVYNDKFVDADDLWRHSKWCEFMFQRLTLSRELLREDGAIVVSIDDNEIFSLGLLMNRVFGENNFVATCVWQKRYSRENREAIGDAHEYLVVFAKRADIFKKTRGLIPLTEQQAKVYKPSKSEPHRRWRAIPMTAQGYRPNQMYEVITPAGVKHSPPEGRCWSMTEPEYLKLREQGRIYFGKDDKAQPGVIRFLDEVEGFVPWTWWPHEEVGHTDEARKEIREWLDTQTAFQTPKPVRLIERVLQICCGKDDLVVDFFAGSGTTAHAVLKLNKQDGGNRRFILVSNRENTVDDPEKNLCRDVCAKRVRRVIEGYAGNEPLGGSFAYLRTSRIAPENLLDLDHQKIWIALQLIHFGQLLSLDEQAVFWAEKDDVGVIYLPRFEKSFVKTLRERVKQCSSVILYSWQPGLVRQHVPGQNVEHEGIPESLARRFGLRK